MVIIDYKDNRPIYEQITEKLQELMVLGALEEDSQMPSVRNLALELSINPNTIQRAYSELERQGFIYSVKGKGSFVGSVKKIREMKKQELFRRLDELIREGKILGITRAEFFDCVERQYLGGQIGGEADDSGSKLDETV